MFGQTDFVDIGVAILGASCRGTKGPIKKIAKKTPYKGAGGRKVPKNN